MMIPFWAQGLDGWVQGLDGWAQGRLAAHSSFASALSSPFRVQPRVVDGFIVLHGCTRPKPY